MTYCSKFECYFSPISRTKTRMHILCNLNHPIKDMFLNLVIETKNSKNIYSKWVNETTNYCEAVKSFQVNFIGFALKLYRSIDPAMVQNCPVSGKWGANNITVDHSVLDTYPIAALPTRNVRTFLNAYTENFDLIGSIKVNVEIKILGA